MSPFCVQFTKLFSLLKLLVASFSLVQLKFQEYDSFGHNTEAIQTE